MSDVCNICNKSIIKSEIDDPTIHLSHFDCFTSINNIQVLSKYELILETEREINDYNRTLYNTCPICNSAVIILQVPDKNNNRYLCPNNHIAVPTREYWENISLK